MPLICAPGTREGAVVDGAHAYIIGIMQRRLLETTKRTTTMNSHCNDGIPVQYGEGLSGSMFLFTNICDVELVVKKWRQ